MNKRVRNKQQQQKREATGSLDGVISLIDSHNPQNTASGRGNEGHGRGGGVKCEEERYIKRKIDRIGRMRLWQCSVLFMPVQLSRKFQCVVGEPLSLI